MTPAPRMQRPLIIGLTGSIGMGKSTVAQMFRDENIAVFDADAQVHRMQGPGGVLVPMIETAFPGTTGPEGTDRQKLAVAVLGNPAKLAALEAIIHPAVAQERMNFIAAHTQDEMVVFDIPLLFEKGGAEAVDQIIVVSAPADIQRRRVLARPGMTAAKFEQILQLQMADAEKRRRADYVIDTSQNLDETRAALRDIINKLRTGLAQSRQKTDTD